MNALIELIPSVIGLLVLLGLSCFFSGSETAFFALNRAQVKRMSTGSTTERAVANLLHRPQCLLSTLLVGNMIVNILLASVIASLAGDRLGNNGALSTVASIACSTLLLIIFGELTPKSIAFRHARPLACAAAIPLLVFSRIITPARALLRVVTHAMLTLIGQPSVPGWGLLTQEEISGMLAAGEAAGVTDARERELVEHIFELSRINAHDIMVPRTEVTAVSDSLTVAEAFAAARKSRHSRLPVYHEGLDDIWGLVHIADLPRWRDSDTIDRPLADFRPHGRPVWSSGSTPVYSVHVVPETAKIEKILPQLRVRHAQMVVLVDEYGGTAGILTMDDILQEIVGQISPIEEAPGEHFVRVANDVLIAGRTHIREINRELDLELPQNGVETVGGHVTELLGRIPRTGDKISDEYCHYEVLNMAGRRIGAIRLTPLPPDDDEGDA
ncbi:MAG: HlyC/CorC family transporter [Lentisphaerae bacterium]|nr:HlyC/CorC family transporter [Lentisphaerota bacterium]MBT5609277.1 HlyC/CorC family transporter [Lentisphaerota bacterium]MBT7059429.1 HlyC/CorC family transporter [Lentisphaerota bacterium]MBT7847813.1 HlyC/CorC family transporter [Lentisphaerota bacterium]